jgi:hypothetical protein
MKLVALSPTPRASADCFVTSASRPMRRPRAPARDPPFFKSHVVRRRPRPDTLSSAIVACTRASTPSRISDTPPYPSCTQERLVRIKARRVPENATALAHAQVLNEIAERHLLLFGELHATSSVSEIAWAKNSLDHPIQHDDVGSGLTSRTAASLTSSRPPALRLAG